MVKVKNVLSNIMRNNFWGLLIISALVVLLIAVFVDPAFGNTITMSYILKSTGLYVTVGMAQLVVMSVGQFSLAIGSIACFSSMVAIYLVGDHGWAVLPAFVVMFIVGAALGAIQGLMTTKLKMQPFIVTLSLQYVYQGLGLALFNGRVLTAVPGWVIKINSGGPLKRRIVKSSATIC